MMPDIQRKELNSLLLDDGLLRTKREQMLSQNAQIEANTAGNVIPLSLLIARKFIRNHMMNPALLRSETIEADKSNPPGYDPLEFAAPNQKIISTYEDSEIPRLVDVSEIDFDKQNVRGGFNGSGVRASYRGGKYFIKKNSSQADIISRSDYEANIIPPRNGALQEVFYINLFHRSRKLAKHTPKSCCFVAPNNLLPITDLFEASYYARPNKIDVFEEIEANRVVIWMDELPVQNNFSRLPILEKLNHYRSTILEFHRFAATEGISMRDDKPDCYCVDDDSMLKRFDFGGCVNFNHKKTDLPKEMTYNILENIYSGIYLTTGSDNSGLGDLGEFNFHKSSRDRSTRLEQNPRGLLLWMASIRLNEEGVSPDEVINTIDEVIAKLISSKSLTKAERMLRYKEFTEVGINASNYETLISLLETEESKIELDRLVSVYKHDINRCIAETPTLQKKRTNKSDMMITFDNMFSEDINWSGLVDLWENTINQKLDETSRRSVSRAIGLLRRNSGCTNILELSMRNWNDILKNLPPHTQESDITIAMHIFNTLKKLSLSVS